MAFRLLVNEYMQIIAGFGTASLYVFSMFPHVWGLPKYQGAVQLYKRGIPFEIDHDTECISQEMLENMKWDLTSMSNVKFFMGYGQDIFHKGSTYTSHGALIGIPIHFQYKQPSDVEKINLKLNNESIDWSSAPGQKLLECMVLSEKAKKFALCRELHYTHSQHIHIKASIISLSALLAYFPGYSVNRMYRLRERTKLGLRLSMYSVFASIAILLCMSVLDRYDWHRDRKSDKKAAETSKDICEGGVEFYTKSLQRNVCIRELMGKPGIRIYTPFGNEIHSVWSNPHVPLTTRKDFVQNILNTKFTDAPNQDQPE